MNTAYPLVTEKNSCQNSNAAYSGKQQWQIQKVVKTSVFLSKIQNASQNTFNIYVCYLL
jgi:hypothetical protein